MSKQVFISLPVADLPRSMAFFQALGYAPNPAFSGDEAACIVINDTTFVMLLSHAKWRGMTTKAICDARQSAEVSINLACESREQVIGLMAKAVAAGLKFRPLADTSKATLAWYDALPPETQTRILPQPPHQVTPDREKEVLEAWKKSQAGKG